MEILWHDNTCFTVRGKKKSLVINPHKKAGNLKGDIVLNSIGEEASEVQGDNKIFNWPGEYEIKDIPINALEAWTKAKSKEGKTKADNTLIFCFQFGKVKFCHLGELGHALTSEMVADIGDTDVLMIKVGEGANLDSKKAMEIIEAIEPRAVIPMGNNSPAASLKEIGADKVESVDKFEIKSSSDLPTDKMQYIVLNKA